MSLLDDIKDLPPQKWGGVFLPDRKSGELIKRLAMQARQFIFDEAASVTVGRFIRECPDLLVEQMEFAIPPFDACYIELDINAVQRGIGRPGSMEGDKADWKVGFLTEYGVSTMLMNSKAHPDAALSPFGIIDRDVVGRNNRPLVSVADSLINIDAEQLLGSTFHDLTPMQREAFVRRFGSFYLGPDNLRREALKHMLPASKGEVRVWVAALLFLHQRQHITIKDHPFERKITRGKLRTFMAHSTVTINLTEPIEIRRAFNINDRASPRAHEVRTHYAHRHGRVHCEHDWVRIEDADNEQWVCRRCERLRYLVRSHVRGDGSKGFVTKDYNITATQ